MKAEEAFEKLAGLPEPEERKETLAAAVAEGEAVVAERRSNWIGAPEFFELNQACLVLGEAFGWGHTYLVGSALTRRDHRDVDIRTILDDEIFDRLFPGAAQTDFQRTPLWSLMCSAISLWLSRHSGLKIDFQIQPQTYANKKFPGSRSAIGMFYDPGLPKDHPV